MPKAQNSKNIFKCGDCPWTSPSIAEFNYHLSSTSHLPKYIPPNTNPPPKASKPPAKAPKKPAKKLPKPPSKSLPPGYLPFIFYCPEASTCPRMFKTETDLCSHVQADHGRELTPAEKNKANYKYVRLTWSKVIYKCDWCIWYGIKEDFNPHISNLHPGELAKLTPEENASLLNRSAKHVLWSKAWRALQVLTEAPPATVKKGKKGLQLFHCTQPGCNASFRVGGKLKIHKVNEHQLKGETVEDPVPFWSCPQRNCSYISLNRKQVGSHVESKHNLKRKKGYKPPQKTDSHLVGISKAGKKKKNLVKNERNGDVQDQRDFEMVEIKIEPDLRID